MRASRAARSPPRRHRTSSTASTSRLVPAWTMRVLPPWCVPPCDLQEVETPKRPRGWSVGVCPTSRPGQPDAMADELNGKKVAFLVATEGTEQVELEKPWQAVEEAGGTPELISTDTGEIQAFNHLDKADTFPVDKAVTDASVDDYDGLVLPGGVANPDFLRQDAGAVAFARGFFEQGKPVAVICHGPWTLVEADVVRGRTLTSFPSLRTDIENAGGTWVDEEVHGDSGLVSSRNPGGLPAFCAKLVEEIAEGEHEAQKESVSEASAGAAQSA